jgi:hypothetical protein
MPRNPKKTKSKRSLANFYRQNTKMVWIITAYVLLSLVALYYQVGAEELFTVKTFIVIPIALVFFPIGLSFGWTAWVPSAQPSFANLVMGWAIYIGLVVVMLRTVNRHLSAILSVLLLFLFIVNLRGCTREDFGRIYLGPCGAACEAAPAPATQTP